MGWERLFYLKEEKIGWCVERILRLLKKNQLDEVYR